MSRVNALQTHIALARNVLKYNEDEARGEDGRWTSGDGGSGAKESAKSFTDPVAAQTWAEQHFSNPAARKYNPKDPVQDYFSMGFKEINSFMRKPASIDRDFHNELKGRVKAIKQEMRPVPTGGVTVFRGMVSTQGRKDIFTPGTQFTERAFSSTSLDQRVAQQFADKFSQGKGIVAQIEVPAGTKALYHSTDVQWGNGWTNENELLLEPNVKYETVGYDRESGILKLRVVK